MNELLIAINLALFPIAPEPSYEIPTVEAQAWTSYVATAYTAGFESTGKRPGDAGYGITASGDDVREGYTVACPPELAFGTRLEIEGVGERVCTDRGGAIKGKRIDVYIADLREALEFGRQTVEVRIINEEAD